MSLSLPLKAVGLGMYAYTLWVFTSLLLFVAGVHDFLPPQVRALFPPNSIDGPAPGAAADELLAAGARNLGLLFIFFGQHAVMARTPFKKALTKVIPWQLERGVFCLVTSAIFHLIIFNWTPLPQIVVRLPDALFQVALAMHVGAWVLVLLSTFMIDHFDLFGVSQLFAQEKQHKFILVTRLLYGLVRHPIMSGFIMAFWTYPHFSVGRLLWSSTCTIFIVADVLYLEEPDLETLLGEAYTKYKQQVPGFIPFTGGSGKTKAA